MNMTTSQAIDFFKELAKRNFDKEVEKLVCPPNLHLYAVKELAKENGIELGSQNMYFEEKGAFTGEISPLMLNDLGVKYVILGHSERRGHFFEDDELLNKKLISAFEHGLTPILCVGESLEEREAGVHFEKVKKQIEKDLENIGQELVSKMIIAYEPIWAIGTGKTASKEDAEEMIKAIRDFIKERYSDETGESLRILYGGSVKPSNIKDFMATGNIDGALVGGASLKADDFEALINYR